MDASVLQDSVSRLDTWKVKAIALGEKMNLLEKEEEELGQLYAATLQSVYLQAGFFIAFSNCLVGLYVKDLAVYWVSLLVVMVLLSFCVGVLCPLWFAYKQMCGLKLICRNVVQKRTKLLDAAFKLILEYNGICESSPPKSDLVKEARDLHIERFVRFEIDFIPKFREKHNRKILLAIGICCTIFTVMLLVYAIYKVKHKVVPSPTGAPVFSASPSGLSLPSTTTVGLRKKLLGGRKYLADLH